MQTKQTAHDTAALPEIRGLLELAEEFRRDEWMNLVSPVKSTVLNLLARVQGVDPDRGRNQFLARASDDADRAVRMRVWETGTRNGWFGMV